MVHVLALNCAEHRDVLASLVKGLPVRLTFERFDLPWEEIAARRARHETRRDFPISSSLQHALREAEVIFGFALPRKTGDLAPRLRWVETPATGFDQLHFTGVLDRAGITVTTVGGMFAVDVAEHAFALIFSLTRQLPYFFRAQDRRQWAPRVVEELHGRTLAIVGLGNIGRAVARAARAFGMRISATRPTRQTVPPGTVDVLYDRSDLHNLLSAADIVLVAVSGSKENRNLIDEAALRAMKPHAYLVNVSRGFVVDEQALYAALVEGRIAGAALDVFEEEPLPESSPLWGAPNLVITPHVALTLASRMPRCVRHFAENLARYCRGEPLADVVQHAFPPLG